MTWLILLGKARLYLNWLKRARGRRLFQVLILGLAGLGFSTLVYFMAVETFVALSTFAPGFDRAFIGLIFAGLAVFLLLSGVSTVLFQLYLSSDLNLLMSAPVPLRSIFTVKMVESVLGTGLPTLAGLLALIAYGQALMASPLYYPVAALTLLALLATITSVNALVVMGAMRIVPARRAKEAVTAIGALVGAVIWAAWMILNFNRPDDLQGSLETIRPGAEVLSDQLIWTPPGWAANAVLAFVDGNWASFAQNAGLLFGTTVAFLLISYWVFSRAFYRGWLGAREATSRGPVAVRRGGGATPGLARVLPARVRPLILKDWRVLTRDMRTLSRMIFPIVVVVVLSFGFLGGSTIEGLAPEVEFWRAAGLVVVIVPYIFSSSLALTSVALEGKAFPLLKSAPMPGRTIIWAKVLSWFIPVGILSALVSLVVGFTLGGSTVEMVLLPLMALWFAAGMTVIAVGAGAIAPKFEAENPNRSVGWAGSASWLVGSAIFVLGSGSAIAWGLVFLLDIPLPSMFVANHLIVAGISGGVLAFLGLAIGVTALVVHRGVRTIESWEIAGD